jgi:hypothetical protein
VKHVTASYGVRLQIFGADAVVYIRSVLSDSGRVLSSLLRDLPLGEGQVVASLPAEARLEAVSIDFRRGGLGRKADTGPVLQAMTSHLEASPTACILVDDPGAAPTDPWFLVSEYAFVAYHDEAYPLLSASDFDHEVVAALLQSAGDWHFVGALTHSPPGVSLEKADSVSLETLQKLASNTRALIVGAFDGEAYLIWRRPQPSSGR